MTTIGDYRALQKKLKKVQPGLKRLDGKVSKIWLELVKKRTPVNTGRTRKGWKLRKGRLSNRTPYVAFIYKKGDPQRKPIIQDMVDAAELEAIALYEEGYNDLIK